MPGRIRDDDIAVVRERARIDEIISQYVTLRPAGAGSMKGLCPFHDEKSPSFNVRPAVGFYHCLAGETEVLTWEGVRQIRELAGGTHRILNRNADWVEAPFRSYGVQPLLKITLTRNRQVKEIFATDEHRWFVRAGRTRQSTREVLTKDLKRGDRLAYTCPRSRIRRTTPSPFGIAHGFTYGDGTLKGTGSQALLCPPKDMDLLKWFPNSVTSASGPNLLVHHLPKFFKDRPSLDESTPYLYGWLAGYFAADGCVAADGTVMLNSASRDDLEFVRTLCARLGIGTFGVTEQVRAGFIGREPSSIYRVHFVNDDLTDDFFLISAHRDRYLATAKKYARLGWVVQSVETSDRIEEVYCAEVEQGHAFVLADNILTGNCFGCGEGGDVISFMQKIEQLSFTEAIERLADKVGIQLRYDEGKAGSAPRQNREERTRLVEAHRAAAEFYAESLASPEAMIGRQFLDERGFDREAAAMFGVGYAPQGGEVLRRHLRQLGYSDAELVKAGLVAQGRNAPYDRFRGRLVWPIRDLLGDVVGFGARRLYDDDRIEAKYLNTPETPIYHKSQVLYGVDLAKKDIARSSQAVVVEGYTDVMACHLAGVTTAVATCGTAFGEDHARVLRRLLRDQDELLGRVIFTFDGDEAGQKAALRAFEGDQRFVGQTFVAIEPSGLDPCELRQRSGDAAVRELIARHRPLFEFAVRTKIDEFDLDHAEGRTRALDSAVAVVARIRDRALRDEYARRLAGWVGAPDELAVVRRVRAISGAPDRGAHRQPSAPPPGQQAIGVPIHGDVDPQTLGLERTVLRVAVQRPALAGPSFDDIEPEAFLSPVYRAVREIIAKAGGCATQGGGPTWMEALLAAAPDDTIRQVITQLAVEPVPAEEQAVPRYVESVVLRLHEVWVSRQLVSRKAKLQRTDPSAEPEAYNRLFGELMALEKHRRDLRDRGTS